MVGPQPPRLRVLVPSTQSPHSFVFVGIPVDSARRIDPRVSLIFWNMDRLSRNRLCLRIFNVALVNVVIYTIAYAYVGGDAWNGEIRDGVCYVKGHFLRSSEGRQTPVSRAVWIYSYVHSISIWPSVAGMVLAMLILARPHIIATCRESWISGNTLIAVIGTLVVLICGAGTLIFLLNLMGALTR